MKSLLAALSMISLMSVSTQALAGSDGCGPEGHSLVQELQALQLEALQTVGARPTTIVAGMRWIDISAIAGTASINTMMMLSPELAKASPQRYDEIESLTTRFSVISTKARQNSFYCHKK